MTLIFVASCFKGSREFRSAAKDRLHQWDVLRANKASFAFSLEARVPFLDKQFLDVCMSLDPSLKMVRTTLLSSTITNPLGSGTDIIISLKRKSNINQSKYTHIQYGLIPWNCKWGLLVFLLHEHLTDDSRKSGICGGHHSQIEHHLTYYQTQSWI